MAFLSDVEVIQKYGQPGNPDNFTIIQLPYPMRIAWDISHSVTKIQCHELVADSFVHTFEQILKVYGLAKIQELGIDLFGGCVNIRKMRGSTNRWSRHSFGIAIDLDPSRNGLKTSWANSQFFKKDYEEMLNIFYRNGFANYGKEKNYDAMHFEIIH